jgi:trimethylamine--corrinoid protein Co-methyltransferase
MASEFGQSDSGRHARGSREHGGSSSVGRRSGRPNRQGRGGIQQPGFRQVFNPYRPIEVLTADQVEQIHTASLAVLENIGFKVLGADARQHLKGCGASVDEAEQRVRFDRDMVLEFVARAPSSFTLRGRDPAKKVRMGEGYMAFVSVGGPPFCSDLDRGRRAGNYADFVDFLKVTQQLNIIHVEGGCSIEPVDLPVPTRHLQIYRAQIEFLDKPWKPLTIGRVRARDALEMVKLALGETDEGLAADPVFLAVVNTNTPLTLDGPMGEAIIEMARASQPVCITPFTLAGAMAPTTIAGALVLQNAEVLAGVTLAQAVNPGCPVCYGAFTSNVDMRTGSPAFGTPEYAKAAQASGQLARRYRLPWRSSNVNASCAPDAQAAYEAQMSLWGAVMGHVGVLNQGAGWLEGGLVASFEKLIIDAEMLQMMAAYLNPLVVNEDTLGLAAIAEVGPSGHFFGSSHTLAHYQTAFYAPLLSDWRNFENWRDSGSKTAEVRANEIWKALLKDYKAPPLEPSISDALDAYVAQRAEEIAAGIEVPA